ncbi:hypothetical protein QE152_g8008 [Popillia japonica]|uniref:Uncharacterized protein n=1 Tax=Popillia japonica TaxID=7064 RepID=A0AAW1MDU9_POPJA
MDSKKSKLTDEELCGEAQKIEDCGLELSEEKWEEQYVDSSSEATIGNGSSDTSNVENNNRNIIRVADNGRIEPVGATAESLN